MNPGKIAEEIIKIAVYNISKKCLCDVLKKTPEIYYVGFFKKCRKNGIYLHSSNPAFNHLEIPDSSFNNTRDREV